MTFEDEAALRCSNCEIEGPHGLLYLSGRLRASRCANCGYTQSYWGRLYTEYFRDLTGRTARLPFRLTRDAVKRPTSLLGLPFKAARKPLGLLREMSLVNSFERSRRRKARGADGGA